MGMTRKLTLAALFVALCGIGALIKLPGPFSSVALDLTPALLSVVFLGPVWAGAIAGIGHIVSALSGGLPLGPFHFIVALEMVGIVLIFGWFVRRNRQILGYIWVTLATGLLAPLPFYFLISPALYSALAPLLLLATGINCLLASIALPLVKRAGRQEMIR